MEAATGIQLFPFVHTDPISGTIDLNSLWKQIEALTSPGPVLEIAVLPEPTASQDAIDIGRSARRGKIARIWRERHFWFFGICWQLFCASSALLVHCGHCFFLSYPKFRGPLKCGARLPRGLSDRILQLVEYRTGMAAEDEARRFHEKKSELFRMKEQISQLPSVLNQRLQQLKNDQQRIQLEK